MKLYYYVFFKIFKKSKTLIFTPHNKMRFKIYIFYLIGTFPPHVSTRREDYTENYNDAEQDERIGSQGEIIQVSAS